MLLQEIKRLQRVLHKISKFGAQSTVGAHVELLSGFIISSQFFLFAVSLAEPQSFVRGIARLPFPFLDVLQTPTAFRFNRWCDICTTYTERSHEDVSRFGVSGYDYDSWLLCSDVTYIEPVCLCNAGDGFVLLNCMAYISHSDVSHGWTGNSKLFFVGFSNEQTIMVKCITSFWWYSMLHSWKKLHFPHIFSDLVQEFKTVRAWTVCLSIHQWMRSQTLIATSDISTHLPSWWGPL